MPRRMMKALGIGAVMGLAISHSAESQRTPGLDSLLTRHRAAMARLDSLDGLWRGTGWTLLPNGERAIFTQTIRVGSTGDGALKLLEGRSYDGQGRLGAINTEIFSFDPAKSAFSLRTYTQGTSADVPIVPTGTGFTLEYGPDNAKTRITVVAGSGTWHEVAELLPSGQAPVRVLELTLKKVGPASESAQADSGSTRGPLFDQLARMDSLLFHAAFVACDAQAFRAIFTDDAEFYHDQAGASYGEKARSMNGCPRDQSVRRVLVPGSLQVYPMKDYGAIQTGLHRFVHANGEPGAVAKFVHLWQLKDGVWRLARVLSFDHKQENGAQ